MAKTTSAVKAFIAAYDSEPLASQTLDSAVESLCGSEEFKALLFALVNSPAFSDELGQEFAEAGAVKAVSACRNLRSCLNLTLGRFFGLFSELVTAFDEKAGANWYEFANRMHRGNLGGNKLLEVLQRGSKGSYYKEWAAHLAEQDPHAIYPTSSYRESAAHVVNTDDDEVIEAVMTSKTFTSVRVVENSLDVNQTVLRDVYIAHGRCVCLVDQNVEEHFGQQLDDYFAHHNIRLEKLVYRAMEVDKGIHTVEQMLGDFKMLGVSRNEPVLIVGGGVLADTGGLACALYHRNTPYVMLSTSLVAGIDAGPSPRTCCDGFGYKNLFGSYHAPVLSLTDRYFFRTMPESWLRHGISEIIKMATVKDFELFESLEEVGKELLTTRFGTVDCEPDSRISKLSQKIVAAALRSYVEAEYGNLYETHQCRPHAFGHTWSPGFEIESGLLHGHAVSIGMGFGAFMSYRLGWISEEDMHRVLRLISSFDLSLWHDVMLNKGTLWASQEKIVQKRGRNLAAPLPKDELGKCGYLNTLSQEDLYAAITDYQKVCADYPRQGLGIDPLCSDVGLEDPSTVGDSVARTAAPVHAEAVPVS